MVKDFSLYWDDQTKVEQLPSKVVCVGRNYVNHAKELNNPVPSEPLLFIKPVSSLCDLNQDILIPKQKGSVHHELEVAILIGKSLKSATATEVEQAIIGVGVGLDLTLRDVQDQLKAKSHPWEKAKAFDGACPISYFTDYKNISDVNQISFSMKLNGQYQQVGNTSDMIFSIIPLIAEMSQNFTINAGDIILTGTPEGVGPLVVGDQIEITLQDQVIATTVVV